MIPKKLDCDECSHCCDWVTFHLSKKTTAPKTMHEQVAYYAARGCIIKEDIVAVHISIYSPCGSKVKDGTGCALWRNEHRPIICHRYDCRTDQFLPRGGNYEKGKERP